MAHNTQLGPVIEDHTGERLSENDPSNTFALDTRPCTQLPEQGLQPGERSNLAEPQLGGFAFGS
jgi:hypothetical protein